VLEGQGKGGGGQGPSRSEGRLTPSLLQTYTVLCSPAPCPLPGHGDQNRQAIQAHVFPHWGYRGEDPQVLQGQEGAGGEPLVWS
jgi:hypothetical protein